MDSFKLNELCISILQGLRVPLQVGGEQHQPEKVTMSRIESNKDESFPDISSEEVP